MKLIKLILLTFAVSLSQAHDLKDDSSKKQPQVNDFLYIKKNLFSTCAATLSFATIQWH